MQTAGMRLGRKAVRESRRARSHAIFPEPVPLWLVDRRELTADASEKWTSAIVMSERPGPSWFCDGLGPVALFRSLYILKVEIDREMEIGRKDGEKGEKDSAFHASPYIQE